MLFTKSLIVAGSTPLLVKIDIKADPIIAPSASWVTALNVSALCMPNPTKMGLLKL